MDVNGGPVVQHIETGGLTPGVEDDLRQRFQGSRTELLAARSMARRLARELALMRRLLRFASGGSPTRRVRNPAAASVVQRAVLLTEKTLFHLDSCGQQDGHTMIIGWAFRPIPGWDARVASATILLRNGSLTYAAAAAQDSRPDVAAHFAGQGPDAAGGAEGLSAAGFRCEIINDSLPKGTELEVVLRLDCGGIVCEQPTGRSVRL